MKQSYKIPYSLNKHRGDMEIAIQNKDGIGFKSTPVKIILFYLVAFLCAVFCLTGSFPLVKTLALPFRVVMAILFFAFAWVITQKDAAGMPRYAVLFELSRFMFVKGSRIIRSRNTDKWDTIYITLGIRNIDAKSGLISYLDGTVAYMYRVVGTASALLFEEDKARIIDRVDNFYRRILDNVTYEYITVKEPQKCNLQKYNLQQLNKRLTTDDPDLKNLLKDEYNVLRDFVGNDFKSIHQYLLIKCDNEEDLMRAHTMLRNECSNSSLMFTEVEFLYKKEIIRMLNCVYSS